MTYGIFVRDAMTKNPVVAGPKETVFEGLEKMLDKGVGSLVVVKDNRIVGIVTEKDFLTKVMHKMKDPKKVKLAEVMTKNPISVGPEKDLYEVAKLMNDKNIRRVPVVDRSKLLGVITVKDVLKIEPSMINVLMEKIKIREPDFKPLRSSETAGMCELCGNYEETLVDADGMLLCDSCAKDLAK
jgi:CBS domain-containing protein